MKTSDADNQKWLDDRIEAYLDDELPQEERRRFEQLLDADTAGQQSLTWALSIRDELRALPTPACSPELQKNITKEVRKDAWSGYKSRFFSGLGIFESGLWGQWRPALASLMLLVVASVVVFFVSRPNFPGPAQEFSQTEIGQTEIGQSEIGQSEIDQAEISQAEIDQALAEAKWALGYVSKTGRLTGTSMQDVLAPLMKEQTKD